MGYLVHINYDKRLQDGQGRKKELYECDLYAGIGYLVNIYMLIINSAMLSFRFFSSRQLGIKVRN